MSRLSETIYALCSASNWRRLFVLVIGIVLVQPMAFAAGRWYEVEVLVFAQTQPDFSAESWTRDVGFPNLQGALLAPSLNARPAVLADYGLHQAGDAVAAANDALRVAGVPSAPFRLTDVSRSLARNKNYRPVLHTAWKQAVGAGKDSFKLRIAGGKDFSAQFGGNGQTLLSGSAPALPYGLWEIDGYIKLSAVRYLHAETDLIFRRLATPAVAATPMNTTVAATVPANVEGSVVVNAGPETVHSFRSSQNRRVKANELTYFDHPVFGVLLQLRALEAGKVDASETPPIVIPSPTANDLE